MSTIWITGANRGIGLALTRHYLSAGHTVMAMCRTSSSDLNSTEAVPITGLDVSQPSTYSVITPFLLDHPIDIWIHNAGILRNETLNALDAAAYERILNQLNVNAMGPLFLTGFIQDSLTSSSKLALITSRMGSISDNTSGGRYGYRMSKAALNAAGQSLAVDLRDRGVPVSIIHPGWVQTEMTGHTGHLTAVESARNIIQRIQESTLENTGAFWHSDGSQLPW